VIRGVQSVSERGSTARTTDRNDDGSRPKSLAHSPMLQDWLRIAIVALAVLYAQKANAASRATL
jgi:hypothetical protein